MSKKRPLAHITGDNAIDIAKSYLPKEWVYRPLTPDYGIDLLVELFDFVDKEKKLCETLGEFLFIQVKGTENLKRNRIRIHPVYNVAKSAKWKENKNEFMEIEVINYNIDTSLLDTVRRIGTSTCVLLFVVDTQTKELYFICLNDVLDKYIHPQNPNYTEQNSITVHIPADNKIDGTYESLVPLRLYGKRNKLYSAFTTIRYQLKELRHEINYPVIAFLDDKPEGQNTVEFVNNQLRDYVLFYANQLLHLDIWSIGNHLFALGMCKISLDNLVYQIKENKWIEPKYQAMAFWNEAVRKEGDVEDKHEILCNATLQTWEQLDNLSSIYEEICREWFLPKFIGQLSSYPNSPEIKEMH